MPIASEWYSEATSVQRFGSQPHFDDLRHLAIPYSTPLVTPENNGVLAVNYSQAECTPLVEKGLEELSSPTRLGFRKRLKQHIDSAWGPSEHFLPERRRVEDAGNSSDPFRTLVSNRGALSLQNPKGVHQVSNEEPIHLTETSCIYRYAVEHPGVPQALHETTILHLSDVHLRKNDAGPIEQLDALASYLEKSDTRIDVVAFTGDLITYLPDDLSNVALRALKRITRSASYSAFVLGNHDYHGKTPITVQRFIERAGFDDITNRRTALSVNGARLRFIGVDDAYFGAPYSPHSLPHDGFNVVLTHNLDALRKNFPANVELVLSGHTHWGELNTDWLRRMKVFDGIWWMNKWGYCDNVNGHTQGWDRLTERTLSYVHPGLARHYVPLSFAHMPGFSLHTLKTARATPTCK